MQGSFVKAICQMGTFMICAQAIVHFRPRAAYEKYLKMLVSAMILMQMFLSISEVFSPGRKEMLTERVEWFTDSLEESMQKAAEDAFFSEADLQFDITGMEPEHGEEDPQREGEDTQAVDVQIIPVSPIRVELMQGGEAVE